MTPQQIKANAPEGATHYDDPLGFIMYYKHSHEGVRLFLNFSKEWSMSKHLDLQKLKPL